MKSIASGKKLSRLTRLIGTIERILGFGTKRIACGAGRNFFAIGPNGFLYPCFRFIGIKEYKLGDVKEGIDIDLKFTFQRKIGKPFDKREKCKVCWAAPLCSGPCFANVELLGNKNGEPRSDFCDFVKAECEAAIWLVEVLKNKNPEILLNLLNMDSLFLPTV